MTTVADLLDEVVQLAARRQWGQKITDYPPVEALLKSDPQTQRQCLIDLVDRMRTSGKDFQLRWTFEEIYGRLLQRKLPLEETDILKVIDQARFGTCVGFSIKAAERFVAESGLTDQVRDALTSFRQSLGRGLRSGQEQQKFLKRVAALLGEDEQVEIHVDSNEPWAAKLIADLEQLDDSHRQAMLELVAHASTASGSRPSKKWSKDADSLAGRADAELVAASLKVWIAAFDTPRPTAEDAAERLHVHEWTVAEANADLMKGLIWLASRSADDTLIRAIAAAGLSGQRKIPDIGPRSTKVSNAAIWALSQIDSQLAIGQLAIMRTKIRNKSVQKQIDKAIQNVAERLDVPADEVEELAVPTYGLASVGQRQVQLGEFTAELVVTGTSSTELRWLKADGKQQKSIPKSVKDGHPDTLKEIKASAKDIQKILPAQRDRIDLLHLKQKSWEFACWRDRYLDHPLVGTLARRLVWHFSASEEVDAVWCDGQFLDSAGNRVPVDPSSRVTLWHPVGSPMDEVLGWRQFFESREVRQPFKQAHREVYLLTDAERNTGTYSNRYASHILKQHQYNALCGIRGWDNRLRLCVDDEYPPSYLDLPEWGLRAEFWVEGVGEEYGADTNDAGVYHYLATDQVRFYPIDAGQVTAHAGGGGYDWSPWQGTARPEPLALEDLSPLVFSEVMRDVDLFVGVASVGNDPGWQDGGPDGRYRDYWESYSFGELSATAQTRREILERLIPRLAIGDRCSFSDRFLVVRGDRRTYKIHLGSSNILMEPNDQYLCIVPARGGGPGDKVFLPFEGDQRLSVILSKAIMLADDRKIKDPTILSQIAL